MAIIDVSIIPIGTESPSVSGYVARIHEVLKGYEDVVNYQLTPMNTIIEGELETLLEVVKRLHETPFEEGAYRVATTIRIDDRRDQQKSMQEKVVRVEEKLSR
ncbi:MTH1187 family thiamine-binding protein [Texcoconibacillus texcoconensis]|uniref:Uncharacterized protein (TIGR00106 family) n=1 Tax=Texcoconibacillus texcoconensis TaxID=1095777 RepID=A0A840QP68_9BACI|nr:MTH1187 family thiamine-binding protein [Texcoconibacillus texcoconensis]MBB5173117.1 uncharacterized protein (TIGR00106 family) [Texcoconibacillus texcoconensis]